MNVAKLEMQFFAFMFEFDQTSLLMSGFINVVDTIYMLEVQVVQLGNKIAMCHGEHDDTRRRLVVPNTLRYLITS